MPVIKNRYRKNLKNLLNDLYCETELPALEITESWNYWTDRKIKITYRDGSVNGEGTNSPIDVDYNRLLRNCIDQYKSEIEDNLNSLLTSDKIDYLRPIVEECTARIEHNNQLSKFFKNTKKEDVKHLDHTIVFLPIQKPLLNGLLTYLNKIYSPLFIVHKNKKASEFNLNDYALMQLYISISGEGETINNGNKDEIAKQYGYNGHKLYQEFNKHRNENDRRSLTGSKLKDTNKKKRFEKVLPLLLEKYPIAFARASDEFKIFLSVYDKEHG